jgi:hypothetical protein
MNRDLAVVSFISSVLHHSPGLHLAIMRSKSDMNSLTFSWLTVEHLSIPLPQTFHHPRLLHPFLSSLFPSDHSVTFLRSSLATLTRLIFLLTISSNLMTLISTVPIRSLSRSSLLAPSHTCSSSHLQGWGHSPHVSLQRSSSWSPFLSLRERG